MLEAIQRYLRSLRVERNASEHTIKSYREDLLVWQSYLAELFSGEPRVEQVTAVELRGYVAALHEAGYAPTSIARKLASMRGFFKFAQREGLVASNPAKPLRNPRRQRKLPHFLTTRGDSAAARALRRPASPSGLRDRAILETTYSAGLRVSELVGMNDEDLDLVDGLVASAARGSRERLGPLGRYALDALRAWLDVRSLAARTPPAAASPSLPTVSAGV